VRANHELSRVSVSFDETNLEATSGLPPAAVLAQRLGLAGLAWLALGEIRSGGISGEQRRRNRVCA